LFDYTGSGHVTKEKLGSVMRALGQNPTEEELVTMIAGVDESKNGMIEESEFLNLVGRKVMESSGGNLVLEAFSTFDMTRDGILTFDEIRSMMLSIGEKITDEEIGDMLEAAGCDRDGISYKKFKEVMSV
jgi:calmodulin